MSGLLGIHGQQTPTIAGLKIQTSLYSLPIPLLYGQVRVPGNLIHFPEPPSVGAGSKIATRMKSGQATTRYFAPVAIALGEGTLVGIGRVWSDKSTPEDFVTVYAANGWSLKTGVAGQPVWSLLASRHPEQALFYPSVSYVVHSSLELPNGSLQNFSWEVNGLFQVGGGIVDANAKDILTDLLTHGTRGLAWPTAKLGDWTAFGNYITAAGLFVSTAITNQTDARSAIQDLITATVCAPVWSDGVLKMVPYCDTPLTGHSVTYTPNTTPLYDLTDNDYITANGEDPIHVTRKKPSEAYNQLYVEFEDRAQNYSTNVAEAKIEADIAAYGLRPAPKVTLTCIKDISTARLVAQLLLQRLNAVRNTYGFKVGWRYSLVEPMDLLTLTSANQALATTPVRITGIVELENEAGFEMTAEEWPFGTATATRYQTQGATGYTSQQTVDPGNTFTPVIFEGPYPLPDSPLEIWLAASGSATWGGCDVWVSTDNLTFYNVGRIIGKAAYGALTAALASGPALPAIDSAHTLSVDLTASGGALTSGASSDLAALLTLCFVDGEFLSFQTATLTAAEKYDLSPLGRGAYDSRIPASHAIGSTFVRCDDGVFQYPFPQGVDGQVLYFKLPAFNIYGKALQDIATVPSFAHTIAGKSLALDRNSLNDLKFTDSADGTTRTYTWSRGSSVTTVFVYDTLEQAPPQNDPWPTTGQLPVAILRAGTDSYTVTKPQAGFQRFVQLEPRVGSFLEGPVRRITVDPAPAALAAKISAAVTGAVADLTVTATGGVSDWPVTVDVFEDDPTAAPLVTRTIAATTVFTKLDIATLGGRPLPNREARRWWVRLTNVAGEQAWGSTAADRDALPNGTVTAVDYRGAPQLVVALDDDTDTVRVTVSSGKTKTVTRASGALPAGGGTYAYTVGNALDDATVESLFAVDELRIGYKVELQGGGTWLTIWSGPLHGTPSHAPTVKPRVVKATNGDVADVYVLVETSVNETLRLFVRDAEDIAAPIYGLVVGAGDSTPLNVTSGTEVGPSNFFVTGVASPIAKLSGIALTRDQVQRIYVQVQGKDSGVKSDWVPITLSLKDTPYLDSLSVAWDDASGTLRARVIGGAKCAGVFIKASASPTFSAPLTDAVALTDGADHTSVFTLSAAQRGKTWYVAATPYNGWTGTAVSGLPGSDATGETPVPAAYTLNTAIAHDTNAGTYSLTVTIGDPGSVIDPTNRVKFYKTVNGVRSLVAATTAPGGSATTGDFIYAGTLDPKHNTILEPIVYFVDGTSQIVGAFTYDSDKAANVLTTDVGVNGSNAVVTATFDADTVTGAGAARYRINGGSFTTVTVDPTTRVAQWSVAMSVSATQAVDIEGKDSDGNWGPPVSLTIPLFAANGPSLLVTPTPGSTTYSIAWSGTGTVTLSIDGGSDSTPPASPITGIARPAAGSGGKHYRFKSVFAGQTMTDEVTIPPIDANTVTPGLTCDQGSQSATITQFTITSNNPGGGSAPTVTFKCTGCTADLHDAGSTHVSDGSTVTLSPGSFMVVDVNRAPSTTTTQASIDVLATISGGGTAEITRTIIAQLNVGPSLQVNATPGSSSYSISWSGVGTITVSIDGGSFSTPGSSPITVTRNSSDHTYTFKATADGQEIRQTVLVPALASGGGSLSGTFSSLTNVLGATGNPGLVNFGWAWSGGSVTFEVWVKDTVRYGDSLYHYDGTTGAGATTYGYSAPESISTSLSPTTTIGFLLKSLSGSTYGPTSTTLDANYGSP